MKLKRHSKWFGLPAAAPEEWTGDTEPSTGTAVGREIEPVELNLDIAGITADNNMNSANVSLPLKPYASNAEYLAEELRLLDLRLRGKLLLDSSVRPDTAGMYPEQPMLDSALRRQLGGGDQADDPEQLMEAVSQLERQIGERTAISREAGVRLMLPVISAKLRLSELERNCLIACLAPELERKYERVYACLQNDMNAQSPSVELVASLFAASGEERIAARLSFERSAPLMRYLLERSGEYGDSRIPLIARPLKLEDWSVDMLLGYETVDARLVHATKLSPAVELPEGDGEENETVRRMAAFAGHYYAGAEGWPGILFYCCGADETAQMEAVRAVCARLGTALLTVDLRKLLSLETSYAESLRLIGRHVLLQHTALLFTGFDQLDGGDERYWLNIRKLLQMLGDCAPLAFIAGEGPWRESLTDSPLRFMQVDFPRLDELGRRGVWQSSAGHYSLSPLVNLEDFSGSFRFTAAQIRAALRGGEHIAVWNGAEDARISEKELYQASYLQSGRNIRMLASKVNAVYTWEMLVLPEEPMTQLREICRQVKYRPIVYGEWGFAGRLSMGKGLNILFSGPPGAGKTMAAEVIATELNLEMYKIDVSQIVSKYIGETEKNLSRIFDEAETSNAILFFDEADALFGKRSEVKDAHDRYANIETSYLLQKMEEYSGIVILATNLNQNLDDAFLRRLHYKLEFPFPEKEQRERIWRGMFPAAAPMDAQIDYAFMADKFALAGGNIKNIALNAAFYAAHEGAKVGMKHIMLAAKREYRKLGKTFLPSDYAPYHTLIEVN